MSMQGTPRMAVTVPSQRSVRNSATPNSIASRKMIVALIVAVRPAVLDVEVQEAVGQDIVHVGANAGDAAIIFDVGAQN